MERRAQGRPCRGKNEVGRIGIVESVRNVLRSEKLTDISRKNLALRIGVTPALITYYFPKKESLMEEVVAPVVRDYRIRLLEITRRDLIPEQKLRLIISLLAGLYGEDSKILAIYRSLEELAPETYNEFNIMTGALSDFFFEWRGDARARSFDAAVLQGAVRGMCEFAERARATAQPQTVSATLNEETMERDWFETLHRLLSAGRELFNAQPGQTMAVAVI